MGSVSVAVRAGVLVAGAVALVSGPVVPAAYGAPGGAPSAAGSGGGRVVATAGRSPDRAPASPVAPVPAGGGYAAHVTGSGAAPRAGDGETGPSPRQLVAGLLLAGVAVASAVLAARVRRPGRG
ncbi:MULTISPECIES: hypothetical protein [unclassified Streptomyces]|uniref:hypothetical protein n=1 Tax=unclassified Streptomyces TaxID=2593676 RepID=UPI00131AA691|nr:MULTISPECIES: hypothetical protein [unclassified Streptomyces]